MNDEQKINAVVQSNSNGIIKVSNILSVTDKLLSRENEVENSFNKGYQYQYGKLQGDNESYYKLILTDREFIYKNFHYFDNNALEEDDYEKALEYYNNIVSIKPFWGYAYYYRGIIHESIGNWGLALEDYSSCIKFLPHETCGYRKRAFLYLYEYGEYSKTIEDCKMALKINNHDAVLFRILGEAYSHGKEDIQSAADYYSKAIEIDDSDLETYSSRGKIFWKQGRYLEAIFDFDRCIELDSMHAQSYYYRAELHFLIKNYTKSTHDCSMAIQINESNGLYSCVTSHVYKLRSNLRIIAGDHKGAKEDFKSYEQYKDEFHFSC